MASSGAGSANRARARVTVAETAASPERVLEAARDFSARRAEVWPNVSTKHLEVHQSGDTFAEVTEGTFGGFVWERCRYEWSRPGSVTATVQDSNFLRPGSTWEIRATPHELGSRVEVTTFREYKRGPKGRIMGAVMRAVGERVAGSDLRRALSNIEKAATRGGREPAGDGEQGPRLSDDHKESEGNG